MPPRSLLTLMSALCLCALPAGQALAGVVRCDVQSPGAFDPSWVTFDVESGKAAMGWQRYKVEGRVTRTSHFTDDGRKYNLVLEDPFGDKAKYSRLEVVVFPTPDGQHGMLGVTTVMEDGERHVDSGLSNVRLKCYDAKP